jgi:hypothetical protein
LQTAARAVPVLERGVRVIAGVVYVVLFDGAHHDCNNDLLSDVRYRSRTCTQAISL